MKSKQATVNRMVKSLEVQARNKGRTLKGISDKNFNSFLDELFCDGGETRCIHFLDLADPYALQFGELESKPFDVAKQECVEMALYILTMRNNFL